MSPAVIATILALLAIAAMAMAFLEDGNDPRAARRAKEMATRGPGKKPNAVDASAAKRRLSTQEALKSLSETQKESRRRRVSVRGQIEQAGLELKEISFWIISAVVGLVIAIGVLLSGMGGAFVGLAALAGFCVGLLGLPRWFLQMMIGRRQKQFSSQFADALDVIVRGAKSGLPLNQCLRIIAAESPEPLRAEFKRVVDGQAMGVPLEQNMQKLYERMPLPEVNFFAIVLQIQQKSGGSLSETLGNLSGVLRARKLLKEKVKALSSEAKASAMIIGALPFIVMGMVWLIRPEYIALLFTTTTGNVILLCGAMMYGSGIMVMRTMVNFKF